MKKTALSIFLIIILTVFTGCGQREKANNDTLIMDSSSQIEKTVDQSGHKKNIALVMKTLTNPFFVQMEKGARKAETEKEINLIVKTGAKETSIDQQIAIIEDLIKQKVDGIVIAPGGSTELIPVLKKAQDAGIAIINIDNRLDPELSKNYGLINVPYISVNNELGAYLSAKYIADQVKSPAKAVIIEGIRGAANGEDRKAGALRAFKENPNIKLVASETANWKIDEAHTVIAQLYKSYPDISVIFCANDMMALGVVKYLQEQGKQNVLVAGFDNLDDTRNAIQNGQIQATIDQQAYQQGYMGVLYVLRALEGETLPLETMIDVKLITRNNLK